jgi:hypothetical protein
MSTQTLLYVAILVFCLLIVGLYTSVREFLEVSDDPSQLKDRKINRESP